MAWNPPITPERGKFYIGSLFTQRDPKFHIWEVVEGNLGEGQMRSMCGLKMRRGSLLLHRGMWGRLKRYGPRLCKRCRWGETQAAALISGMDEKETPEEHSFVPEVVE